MSRLLIVFRCTRMLVILTNQRNENVKSAKKVSDTKGKELHG
jgi:hypothetical protein